MPPNPKAVAVGRGNIGQRVSGYFKGVWAELKKVHWPTRKELVTYTGVVIVSVIIVAVALWIIDSVFSFLLGLIL
ncbi:MAG: preprotein translocase subunit SecE [Clostridia bacterium]|nr:preprotein translocase subunit SecE [Clostridia bacterium]